MEAGRIKGISCSAGHSNGLFVSGSMRRGGRFPFCSQTSLYRVRTTTAIVTNSGKPVISGTKNTQADMDCNIFKGSERLHRALMSEIRLHENRPRSGEGRGKPSLCERWSKREAHNYFQSM